MSKVIPAKESACGKTREVEQGRWTSVATPTTSVRQTATR